ncbi:MAG TPA: hypothetical protein VHW44_27085 [Pseudonocardiaceae bacterium]|nr:hypothetical protein [Pseudonocardiaceae bacterium]
MYRGATAQTVLGAVGRIATRCPSCSDAQTSSTVKVTEQPTTGLGDGACTISLADSAWQNGSTLIAARTGTAIVTVLASGGAHDGDTAALALTKQILGSLTGKA